MQLLIFLLFSFFSQAYALDTGTGADGVCTFNGITTATTEFNCTELVVTGVNTFTGTSKVFIKVQNTVDIQGELNVSSVGQVARAGGLNGGTGGLNNNGTNGSAPTDFPDARGRGGQVGSNQASPNDDCSGGAGAGGRHNSIDTVQKGDDGDNSLGGFDCNNPANGGAAPTQSYSSATNLHQEIYGGSGGGGGGGGSRGTTNDFAPGGDGGAGGGILVIYSGGDVTLDGATVRANGANGANGTDISAGFASGPGGGGSGGTVLISTLGTMSVISASTIEALGGLGGTTSVGSLSGANGGRGILRLEDEDGSIDTTLLTSNPPISIGQSPLQTSISDGQNSLSTFSEIEAGCALREIKRHSFQYVHILSFIIIFVLVYLLREFEINKPS